MRKTMKDKILKSVQLAMLFVFASLMIAPVWSQQPSATPADKQAENTAKKENDDLDPASKEKVKSALEKFTKSDFDGSLQILKELAATNPKVIAPRLIQAEWFRASKNDRAFRVCLENATEESPNDPGAFLILGELALQRGELTAAELLFGKTEQILANYNANPDRKKSMGIKLLNDQVALAQVRGRWDQMQTILGQLRKIEGDTPDLCRKIGFSFFQKKEDDNARQWLQHADQLSKGKGTPADALMAQYYINRGDMEKAKASLTSAMAANPASVEVLSLSIMMALSEGDTDTAWNNVQKLCAEKPDLIDAQKLYGNVALYRADYNAAEQMYQKVVNTAPADTDAANGLALALCEQQDPEKKKRAIQYASNNLQKQENNREFLATYGWCLFQIGNLQNAIAILQRSAADGRMSQAAAYYFSVIISKDASKKDQAVKLLQAALNNKQPFAKRKAAEELLKSIQ